MKSIFLKITLLLATFFAFTSCDKDFNSLDSDLADDTHFNLEKYEVENLKAYSKATGPVQSNNLPINALGIYENPYFGTTKAHFVSQVELANTNPTIGDSPVIDSVYLYVPYFSTLKSTSDSGERIYELDSVYGYSEDAKFKLHVYENGYFLRDFDPDEDFESTQKYYTNDKSLVDAYKGTELLNNSSKLSQNEEFVVSNKEIYIYKTNGSGLYVDAAGAVLTNQTDPSLRVIKERKTPGLWLDLKNSFFQQKILDAAASGVLFNNNTFKDYFRGLLFEVEEINPGQGSIAMLDFSSAEFKILFKSSIGGGDALRRTLSLQMGYKTTSSKKSNCVNFIEHSKSAAYSSALSSSDEVNGDDRLYIKGGDGSVVFIDAFNDAELASLRNEMLTKKWLVNEASLTFYIDRDEDAMGNVDSEEEPERIYIFDATNNKPILDYYADNSTSSDVKKNKSSFGGIIQREKVEDINGNKKGIKYKVKLTEYIKQLIKNENDAYDDNLRLGLTVIESINIPENAFINPANPITIGSDVVKFVPVSSVMNPLGTVLHGPLSTATYEDENGNIVPMKLQLEIYFTKPNN